MEEDPIVYADMAAAHAYWKRYQPRLWVSQFGNKLILTDPNRMTETVKKFRDHPGGGVCEVENTSSSNSVSPGPDRIGKMTSPAGAAMGDNGDRDGLADACYEAFIKARERAFAADRSQEKLAGPLTGEVARPALDPMNSRMFLDEIKLIGPRETEELIASARRLYREIGLSLGSIRPPRPQPSVKEHVTVTTRHGVTLTGAMRGAEFSVSREQSSIRKDVKGNDHSLAAEPLGRAADQMWVTEGGCAYRDLVGTVRQRQADVI